MDVISFTNINFKWILDLDVKHKTIKLLDNIEYLSDLGLGNELLNLTLKV